MLPVDFLPDANVKPWCPDIHHGKLQPRKYPQFHYTHGWVIQGVKGRFSSPVPKHWRCCPICAKERPVTHECSVTHGVSARIHRLKGLGNAVVPQIAEEIAWMIRRAIEEIL